MARYFMNVIESERGLVLGICDEEVINRRFEEGDLVLDLTSSFFTEGKERSIKEIIEHINIAYTANIVGNKIIEELILQGILKRENIKKISGIKYAHIYRID